ncbi:MAG: hypothetical protein R3F37_11535 [Candidatus Competibacteraceae bacterium]
MKASAWRRWSDLEAEQRVPSLEQLNRHSRLVLQAAIQGAAKAPSSTSSRLSGR